MNDENKVIVSKFFNTSCKPNCRECALNIEECFRVFREERKRPCDYIGEALACLIEKFDKGEGFKKDKLMNL